METARAHTLKLGPGFKLLIGLTLITTGLWVLPARADIYSWKDVNGVLHFSNHTPPTEAELLMVEYFPEQVSDQNPENPTAAADTQSDALHKQLEAANRKLEAALDKVDALSEKVEQTRREAGDAADAARRAEAEAAAASQARSEQTVVFGLPYRRPHHHPPQPVPYYWQLDTSRYPYYHDDQKHHHPHDPSPRTPGGISTGSRRFGGSTATTVGGNISRDR